MWNRHQPLSWHDIVGWHLLSILVLRICACAQGCIFVLCILVYADLFVCMLPWPIFLEPAGYERPCAINEPWTLNLEPTYAWRRSQLWWSIPTLILLLMSWGGLWYCQYTQITKLQNSWPSLVFDKITPFFLPIIPFSYSQKFYRFFQAILFLLPIVLTFSSILMAESGQNDLFTLHFFTMTKR